ncbi:DUF1971 domain-containing protein [Paenalcaligenes hominis]|uniref:DUF1971 domain-containing protein n=1 Tax=Paenalcaligenes hominis TaxID=643674 RepID=UPI003611562D
MSHIVIPKHWKIKRSTHFFTKDNVPKALLTHHNTAAGVYGQICVMQGTVIFYGFANETDTTPEQTIVIQAGQFAVSPRNIGIASSLVMTPSSILTFGLTLTPKIKRA